MGVPVTGIKAEEPRSVLEANGRLPTNKAGITRERIGLIDPRTNDDPVTVVGLGL